MLIVTRFIYVIFLALISISTANAQEFYQDILSWSEQPQKISDADKKLLKDHVLKIKSEYIHLLEASIIKFDQKIELAPQIIKNAANGLYFDRGLISIAPLQGKSTLSREEFVNLQKMFFEDLLTDIEEDKGFKGPLKNLLRKMDFITDRWMFMTCLGKTSPCDIFNMDDKRRPRWQESIIKQRRLSST